jgi:hypothetical protein
MASAAALRMAALTLALVLGAGAARADMVVIRSTAPDVAAGQVVAAGAHLTVPRGASVTLLAADGGMQTVEAPGGVVGGRPPAPAEAGVLGTLAALLDTSAGETRLGAARGLGQPHCATPEGMLDPAAIAALARRGCPDEARQALLGLTRR